MTSRMKRLSTNDRSRAAIELAIVFVLTETWLWSSSTNKLYHLFIAIVLASIVVTFLINQKHRTAMVEPPVWSASQSWIAMIAITCALGALTYFSASFLYSDGEQLRIGRLDRLLIPRILADKAFIVILQQFILCRFLFPLYRDIFRRRTAAFGATAATFGVLHLPSMFLVGVTAATAAIWLLLFERSRRLAPLIVSHLILVIIAAAVFPQRLGYNLAVGRNALPIAHLYRQITEGPDADKYAQFKSSTYYEMNGSNDSAFIRALYRDILRRSPSDAEIDAWLPTLHQNGRAEAVAQFLGSPEYLALRCRHDGVCDQPQQSTVKHQSG